jgi:hypothetical protein
MGDSNAWGPVLAAIVGAGSSAFAPSPFQPRTRFTDPSQATGSNDPQAVMGDAQRALQGIFGLEAGRATSPVELPDAKVNPLPTFSGGGLPMPIGMLEGDMSSLGDLGTGPSLDPRSNQISPIGSAGASGGADTSLTNLFSPRSVPPGIGLNGGGGILPILPNPLQTGGTTGDASTGPSPGAGDASGATWVGSEGTPQPNPLHQPHLPPTVPNLESLSPMGMSPMGGTGTNGFDPTHLAALSLLSHIASGGGA